MVDEDGIHMYDNACLMLIAHNENSMHKFTIFIYVFFFQKKSL